MKPTSLDLPNSKVDRAFCEMGVAAPVCRKNCRLFLAVETAQELPSGRKNPFDAATHIRIVICNFKPEPAELSEIVRLSEKSEHTPRGMWSLLENELRRALEALSKRDPKANARRQHGGTRVRGKPPAKSVEEYLADTPEPAQSALRHIRAVIQSVVPKETTEVISYGIPMFKFNGMLVGYAAFKNHCSLFPTGSSVLDRFEKELQGHRVSKGTIHFTPDKPLPDALVKKIVKARVAENKEWD